MRLQVKDFMSSPVITATGENNVREIRDLMKRKQVHAIPIIQYAKKFPEVEVLIKGIITVTDLSVGIADDVLVKDLMAQKIHIIHKESNVQAAANMMLKHHVHHLIVMDEGEVVGIVSSLDFVKLLSKYSLA